MERVREGADRAAESLSNIPSGYKLLQLRRFQAQDALSPAPSMPYAGDVMQPPTSSGNVVEHHYHVEHLTVETRLPDAEELADTVVETLRTRSLAQFGTTERWAETV